LINIREFYEKDDEYLPGKKVLGIRIGDVAGLMVE
jgi:hypothetical protein